MVDQIGRRLTGLALVLALLALAGVLLLLLLPPEQPAVSVGSQALVTQFTGLKVRGNAEITGTTALGGAVVLSDTAQVFGALTLAGVTATGLTVHGSAAVSDTLTVSGTAALATISVGGITLEVSDPITVSGTLTNVRLLYYAEPPGE